MRYASTRRNPSMLGSAPPHAAIVNCHPHATAPLRLKGCNLAADTKPPVQGLCMATAEEARFPAQPSLHGQLSAAFSKLQTPVRARSGDSRCERSGELMAMPAVRPSAAGRRNRAGESRASGASALRTPMHALIDRVVDTCARESAWTGLGAQSFPPGPLRAHQGKPGGHAV